MMRNNRTSLLVSVKNLLEIEKIKEFVDIIDLKNPNAGALGAWAKKDIIEATKRYSDEIILSATLGNYKSKNVIFNRLRFFDRLGLYYIKIGFFTDSIKETNALFKLINSTNSKTKIVPVFFAEHKNTINYIFNNLEILLIHQIDTILIDTINKKSVNLLEIYPYQFLKNFINLGKENNIKIGLAGKVKKKEIKKLINLKPYLIGVRSAVCDSQNRNLSLSYDLTKKVHFYFFSATKNAQAVAGA